MYPEVMDDFSELISDEKLTRSILAEILVKYNHKPIYVPSSSKYYKKEYKGHTYGFFEDVVFTEEYYDYIETAVMAGWIEEIKEQQGEDINIEIKDMDEVENKKIVQILVDNKIFELNDKGLFNPKETLSIREVVKMLNKL